MKHLKIKSYLLLLITGFFFAPGISIAKIVELNISPKVIATADYKSGKPELPAVILIHGFLQTRDSPTIRHLADELASSGYTILVPTLSLGITKRMQSLGCEAIHHHTMDEDNREIGQWVTWLNTKKYQNIVLLGHSRGGNSILSYLNGKPSQSVKKGILLSLPDDETLGDTVLNRKKLIELARQNLKNAPNELAPYKISFCDKYMATPESYLSFFDFTRSMALNSLKTSKKPVEVIFGSKDDRMAKDWPDRIKSIGISMTIISNANHFFSDQAEFDLNDTVIKSLGALRMER